MSVRDLWNTIVDTTLSCTDNENQLTSYSYIHLFHIEFADLLHMISSLPRPLPALPK